MISLIYSPSVTHCTPNVFVPDWLESIRLRWAESAILGRRGGRSSFQDQTDRRLEKYLAVSWWVESCRRTDKDSAWVQFVFVPTDHDVSYHWV